MSKKRNKKTDAQITKAMVALCHVEGQKTNWLGHDIGSGAAKIDALLLVGASDDELEKMRRAVDQHIAHLRDEHDLEVETVGELRRFKR